MPAVLDPPVRARQRLTINELADEALELYAEYRERGGTQGDLAERIGTTQSAVSEAVRRVAGESRHAAVYERMVGALSPSYRVVREETITFRVERKAS